MSYPAARIRCVLVSNWWWLRKPAVGERVASSRHVSVITTSYIATSHRSMVKIVEC